MFTANWSRIAGKATAIGIVGIVLGLLASLSYLGSAAFVGVILASFLAVRMPSASKWDLIMGAAVPLVILFSPSVGGVDYSGTVVAIIAVVYALFTRRTRKMHPIVTWLMLLAIYQMAVRVVVAPWEPVQVAKELVRVCMPLLLFVGWGQIVLDLGQRNRRQIAVVLGGAGAFVALIGLVEWISPSVHEFMIQLYVPAGKASAYLGGSFRMVGPFGNPNIVGMFLAICICLTQFYLVDILSSGLGRRAAVAALLSMVAALLLTQSRTALVAVLMGELAGLFVDRRKWHYTLVGLGVGIFILVQGGADLSRIQLMFQLGLSEQSSWLGRMQIWDAVEPMLTGVQSIIGHGVLPVEGAIDNEYIRIALQFGWIGVFGQLLLWGCCIGIVWGRRTLRSPSLAVVVCMAVSCFTGEFLSNIKLGYVFYLFVYLLIIESTDRGGLNIADLYTESVSPMAETGR